MGLLEVPGTGPRAVRGAGRVQKEKVTITPNAFSAVLSTKRGEGEGSCELGSPIRNGPSARPHFQDGYTGKHHTQQKP